MRLATWAARWSGMESYLRKRFGGVQAKHSSEEALRRWRHNCGVVKNPRRRFRYTADLEMRAKAEAIKHANHEAALQFLVGLCNCVPTYPLFRLRCSQWEKGDPIGSGSFGDVYHGYNRELGLCCAIKEVAVIPNDKRSKERLRQLNQEIYLLTKLSHPNIVQYYGSVMTNNVVSIFMEYVSEGSIRKLLDNNDPFTESLIRNYTQQILSGLAFLHANKHIHRDIKGANILVGPINEVKIADFGLSKHIQTLTAVHTSCRGTPYFMAPEVILSNSSGEGYNLPADIWSLGCTIIEMATGKPPLHGYEPHQAMFKIAYDKTYIPEIPEVLSDEGKDFVKLCLQRDRKARPSAAELMDHPFIRNQGS